MKLYPTRSARDSLPPGKHRNIISMTLMYRQEMFTTISVSVWKLKRPGAGEPDTTAAVAQEHWSTL